MAQDQPPKPHSMRPPAHAIDTRAVQRVQLALPATWVPRLTTERDYGVDMLIELFDESRPAGAYLMLQIKGADEAWATGQAFKIQFPVRTLRYAELWSAPVLAVVCPTLNEPSAFAYLWLQEYIDVVLDVDKPNWRQQDTVTLEIPGDNWMPGNEATLLWIADHAARVKALGQLARIEHELRYATDEVGLEFEARGICLE